MFPERESSSFEPMTPSEMGSCWLHYCVRLYSFDDCRGELIVAECYRRMDALADYHYHPD